MQFGTDPRRAVVLDGLTPPLRRMVAALDGTRCAGVVIADAVARGVPPAPARATLDHLAAAGLLDVRASGPTGASGTVVVRGRGRLAVALAGVLAGAGLAVGVITSGVVDAADTGTGLTAADIGRPVGEAMARAIPGVRSGPGPRPDLVVLTGAAVDPALADDLLRRGRAHLAVAVRDGVGYVGPLVEPGSGACLRCAELARCDADPAWPTVLAQLVGSSPPIGVTDAAATAALAGAQVLTALTPGPAIPIGPTPVRPVPRPAAPATLGGVLELDLDRGTLGRTVVAAHPACPCRATPLETADRPASGGARAPRPGDVARVA